MMRTRGIVGAAAALAAFAGGALPACAQDRGYEPYHEDAYYAEPSNDLFESSWYDDNEYGLGDDVFDDKWDTGVWDMGEHDYREYPAAYKRDYSMYERGTAAFDRVWGINRYDPFIPQPEDNIYGAGDDWYDDKWDTGLWDMGEYDADEYPAVYRSDDRTWDTGPSDTGRYGTGAYTDSTGYYDVGTYENYDYDDAGVYERYEIFGADQNPYGVGGDVFDDKWDVGPWDMGEYDYREYPSAYRQDYFTYDAGTEAFERAWGYNAYDPYAYHDGYPVYDAYEVVDVNPYGVGYDVYDDKWDMGLLDMGEFDADDWPLSYAADVPSWYTIDWYDDDLYDDGWFGW